MEAIAAAVIAALLWRIAGELSSIRRETRERLDGVLRLERFIEDHLSRLGSTNAASGDLIEEPRHLVPISTR